MQLKQLLNDDDAVSPVIGVILMVAITVILAAVIGTFVLGLGDQVQDTAPNAQIATDFNDSVVHAEQHLELTHDGGDSVDDGNVDVLANPVQNSEGEDLCGSDNSEAWSGDLTAGSTCTINGDVNIGGSAVFDGSAAPLNETTVRVVWSSSSGDTSSTLREWEGPEA